MSINSLNSLVRSIRLMILDEPVQGHRDIYLVMVRSTRLLILDETVHGHRDIYLVIGRSTRLMILYGTVHSDGDIQTVMQDNSKHGFILRGSFLIHDLSPGLLLD
jgi:ABC-type Mn2+/Zn2+ transport system ATPase subunit